MRVIGIGRRMREARKNEGLTQADAAYEAGVAATTWLAYEHGKLIPRMPTLVRFCLGSPNDPIAFILDDHSLAANRYRIGKLGERIGIALRRYDKSLFDVASGMQTHSTTTTIFAWQSGKHQPSIVNIMQMARYFGESPRWLAGFDSKRKGDK